MSTISSSAPSPAATAPRFDQAQLRAAFAQFPQGVVAVAAEIGGKPEGIVASTFTVGVSLDPPLVTFAVQHSSSTWPKLRESASRLGISVIGREQFGLCRQIASKDRENRFAGVPHTVHDNGALTIDGAPMWLNTRIYDQITAGDHDIVVLEVLDLDVVPGEEGLVFHESEFKELSPVVVPV